MVDAPAPDLSVAQADATIRSRAYAGLLVAVAIIGVLVSLAAWCFLELIHQIQQELYTHLPHALGYENGPPRWWPLPILAVGAALTAIAIARLPGKGGHVPAEGLKVGSPGGPQVLPGVLAAGIATIGSGLVLGPEAPLIALGGGLAALTIQLARRDVPQQAQTLIAAAGAFAAVSFIFGSPLIAAVLLIEASAIGGQRMRVLLVPGLLAAGIGTLVSLGMGSFTGLSTSAYALGTLPLTHASRPDVAEFGWTIAFAVVIALVTSLIMRGGRDTHRIVSRKGMLWLLPVIGLIVGGLAIAFAQITGKSVEEVLFSGQDQLPGLISSAGSWSVSALILLILFKGVAYSLSLGSFRGGPTFPVLFLGVAGGIAASHLPGFPVQIGIAVGLGAGFVSVLRLPLSAVVLATVLTSRAGADVEPLIVVGVVVAYVITLWRARPATQASPLEPQVQPAPEPVAPAPA